MQKLKQKQFRPNRKAKRSMDLNDRQFSAHTDEHSHQSNHALLKYWSHFPALNPSDSPFYTFTLHRLHFAPTLLHLHILNF